MVTEIEKHYKEKIEKRKFKQRRYTTHVRVQKKWIDWLKNIAKREKITVSKLNDKIYSFYKKQLI